MKIIPIDEKLTIINTWSYTFTIYKLANGRFGARLVRASYMSLGEYIRDTGLGTKAELVTESYDVVSKGVWEVVQRIVSDNREH